VPPEPSETTEPGDLDGPLQPGLSHRLYQLLRKRPVSAVSVSGGYTTASRMIVTFEDGSSAFVKAANDQLTAAWLRDEYRVYAALEETFMPRVLAWEDISGADHSDHNSNVPNSSNYPLLVLEDLSGGIWPTSWTDGEIAAVLATLARVRRMPPPHGIRTLESYREDFIGWQAVADDPEPFLSLGFCSERWLEKSLPTLIEADKNVILAGDEFIHLDIRSDNICFFNGRVMFVDWNWACVGNSKVDVVFWLPSLACEGGAVPEELIDDDPLLMALAAGFWAKRAGLPAPTPGSKVRELQRKQLQVALPWTARALGLQPVF